MTPMPTRSEQLIHVARLFYEKNLSKTAIAVQMKLSVTHVARLIEEARATGVVRIEIGGPRQKSLARDLIEKFSCLRDAVVVGSEIDYTLNTRTLAKTAAEYFDEEIRRRGRLKVGLSGGLTVFEFVKALPEEQRNIVLYPTAILGRGDTIVNHIDPIASLMVLWGKCGYPVNGLFLVTVTPLEKKSRGQPLSLSEIQEEIDGLLKREKVKRLYDSMANVDMVFASLRQMGLPRGKTKEMGAMAVDLLGDVGVEEKDLLGAVGDVNYSFIDEAGQSRNEWRLFLSLQADQLREMARNRSKRVVIIAGQYKERILHAALRGGLLNVLITDERTANHLLEQPT